MQTAKRASLHLTKEDLRQLEWLSKQLGESHSAIFRRALQFYYDKMHADFNNNNS